MKFGIDRLLADPTLRAPLASKRISLLVRPPQLTADLTHSLDALAACPDIRLPSAAFRAPARPARRQAGQHGRERTIATPRSASRCSASTARCADPPTR